jgi:DoxX
VGLPPDRPRSCTTSSDPRICGLIRRLPTDLLSWQIARKTADRGMLATYKGSRPLAAYVRDIHEVPSERRMSSLLRCAVGSLILRVAKGGLLAGHGAQKLFGWFEGHGLDGTGAWLESIGFRPEKRNAGFLGIPIRFSWRGGRRDRSRSVSRLLATSNRHSAIATG